MVGITAYGAYVPRLRLSRKAIAQANSWFSPGLAGQGKGERAMASWDEDSLTMSVEAARDCLTGRNREDVRAVFFASTTMPFADRQNAGVIAAALTLDEGIGTTDVAGSQRAGLTALQNALAAAEAGFAKTALVVASDRRHARVASTQEMQIGDGAAAVTVGKTGEIARLLGGHSVSVDFVDHFRSEGEEFDYGWEERWIRDEGYARLVPKAVAGALKVAKLTGADIAHFVLPCVFRGLPESLAKTCGIPETAVADNLGATLGDTGSAHALVMLVNTLEKAKPGDKIVVAQFGQGCDALVFEVTPAIADLPKRAGLSGALKRRKETSNYMKLLAFTGQVEVEKGMRAEAEKKTALTTLYRKRDMIMGLVGGRCTKCGTAQFPRARICVNPNCKAVDSQEPYNFAEQTGNVLSWSADYLTYCLDPPQHYGMITFAEGGRFMADFTDVEPGEVETGGSVKMMFRIKDFDTKRNFRRYFWKAVPV